jgi:BirA family biotin operon repressor/biotin-[acetyl-CoA-carboxylase] ligase
MNKFYFDSLESTNTYLKDHHENHQHFNVIITDNQSKGRGRKDHIWFSTKDSLTFSILIKDIDESSKALLPYYTAYVLHKSLNIDSKDLKIKWPNDLLLKGQKLSGILVESVYQKSLKASIVGIGLNINQDSFPKDLKTIATSLKIHGNQDYDKEDILNRILSLFEKNYNAFIEKPSHVIDYCNQHLAYKGQEVTVLTQKTQIKGRLMGINIQGYLVLEENQHITHIVSGELIT